MILLQIFMASLWAQDTVTTAPASPTAEDLWKFKNETEVSLVVADGNTESETYVIKQSNELKKDKDIFVFKGSFLQTKSVGIKTGESWFYSPRYERELSSTVNAFTAFTEESDKFAGYDRRRSFDIGAKLFLKKVDDIEELFTELNYRSTREKPIVGDSDTSDYGRLYTEWFRKWTSSWSTKLWVEYIHNLESSKDYKLNFEPSASVVLTDTFSLKLAYLSKYQNAPNAGAEKRDSLYTTAIVASF